MAALMVAVAGMAWAQETQTFATPNETPDNTWMTNGKVTSTIRSGDYIYVGGKFTRARSAVSGGKSFVATNIARFDADTGVGDPTWTPDVTGADTTTAVYALAAAGGKIWVGGKFNAVDGISRRNLAAVSEQTGIVDPNVDPLVGSEISNVQALIASETKVYIGGGFGVVNDGNGPEIRNNLAALDLEGNLDQTWKPQADSKVHSLAFSCDETTVFAGGVFRNAAGSDGIFSPRQQVARFDATSGELHPWAIAGSVGNEEVAADLAVTCERITVAFLGPNWTRSMRLDNGDTGTVVWAIKSSGEAQTLTMFGPDKIVIGGHFSSFNGARRTGIALINLSDGSVDPNWAPVLTAGGSGFVSVWETFVDENHVYIGGLFNTVEGLQRTNFARFSWDVPDTTSPTVSSVVPADGQTEVALEANAEATFSEAIDPATLNNTTFTLTKADGTPEGTPEGTPVAASVSYDSTTKKATLNPEVDLESRATYTATIKGGTEGVKDLSGNALAADKVWSFTTTAACTITGTSNSETLTGTPADDVICAGAGNDIIKGLEGNDTLKGEAGTDTANFSNSVAAISASLINNSASGEGTDTLMSIENLTGSLYADELSGSGAKNTITGGGGADVLTGLGGADKLVGNAGNDTLDSQDGVEGNDSVDGGGGTDTCKTDATELSILNCEQ
jgi:hypothetical protein